DDSVLVTVAEVTEQVGERLDFRDLVGGEPFAPDEIEPEAILLFIQDEEEPRPPAVDEALEAGGEQGFVIKSAQIARLLPLAFVQMAEIVDNDRHKLPLSSWTLVRRQSVRNGNVSGYKR